MMPNRSSSILVAWALWFLPAAAFAAGAPDSASLLAAQRQSMQALAIFDGAWRGPAKVISADGHGEHVEDFPFEVRPDGFTWSIKAGPATMRYTATVKDGVWTEIGERIVEGQPNVRIFEMTLRRMGSTDWPGAGAVQPK